MDKKELRKMLRAEFGVFFFESGFCMYNKDTYLKINENILYNVTFEIGSIDFTCAIAMQPLYIKDHSSTTFLHLTFGNRLSRFRVAQREWWSFDEPLKGIGEIKELLSRNGLPWFDQYGTPEGIVEFISQGKAMEYGLWLYSFFLKQYLGFSLLYTGHIGEGIQALEDMLSEIKEDAVEWLHEYKSQMTEMTGRIMNHPNDVKLVFDKIIRENKNVLKI